MQTKSLRHFCLLDYLNSERNFWVIEDSLIKSLIKELVSCCRTLSIPINIKIELNQLVDSISNSNISYLEILQKLKNLELNLRNEYLKDTSYKTLGSLLMIFSLLSDSSLLISKNNK